MVRFSDPQHCQGGQFARLVLNLCFFAGLALLAGGAMAEPALVPIPPEGRGDALPAPVEIPKAPAPRPEIAPESDPARAAKLFAQPAIASDLRAAAVAVRARDVQSALIRIDRSLSQHPDSGILHSSRAVLSVLDGDFPAALSHIEQALATGDVSPSEFKDDPVLALLDTELETRAAFSALLQQYPERQGPAIEPASRIGQIAPVTARNTSWDVEQERLIPHFALEPKPKARVVPSRPKKAAWDILREHVKRGRAAGNHGDLYDNRDRNHSALDQSAHPQLTHIHYSDAVRAAGLDYGVAGPFLFQLPTLGNSSTAFTRGPLWRSQPRHGLTLADGTGPMRMWQSAHANHLYVYPAHKDFTPGSPLDGAGDLFPANTPYILISRGSSGSDKPILRAIAMIWAAFRPDTKARLIENNLLVSTTQMIFRRSLHNVKSRESYFSSDAHPAAFDTSQINLARMVSLANAIRAEALPAEVRLRVVSEELGEEGVDYFGEGLTERLFETPGAIAWLWRSRVGRRSFVVSAEDSFDANGRALAFHWKLLQGDTSKVKIEPLDGGKRARITLDWHEPFAISDTSEISSARVDIGVFANNGVHDSAPAILSWAYPVHQLRTYVPSDNGPQVAEIDHASPERAKTYADPMLWPRADWRDTYSPGAGWTRHRTRGDTEFSAEGRLIGGGAPEAVRYRISRTQDSHARLEQVPLEPVQDSSTGSD